MRRYFILALAILMTAAVLAWGRTPAGEGAGGWELGRIAIVFCLVVALLRFNVDIGLTLLATALALGLFFDVSVAKMSRALTLGLAPGPEIERTGLLHYLRDATVLVIVVSLINVLGRMMSVSGAVDRLIAALERLSGDVRVVAAVIPSTLGLLPMPGGAMMTAPFVEDLGNRLGFDGTRKTGVNYWFRHVWEYWWPMFPAVVLMTQSGKFLPVPFSLLDLAAPGLIFSGVSILAGWWFLLRGQRRVSQPVGEAKGGRGADIHTALVTFWPIAVIVLVVAFGPPFLPKLLDKWEKPSLAAIASRQKDLIFPATMIIIDIALWAMYKLSLRQVGKILANAFAPRMVFVLYAVYILRAMFDVSGAATRLPETLTSFHLPVWLICFLVPWIVGMLTGYTIAGVSAAFPLLGALLGTHAAIIIAYMGAFIGVLMSPVHLCLILTKQYFNAGFSAIYRMLVPCFAVILTAVAAVGTAMWLLK